MRIAYVVCSFPPSRGGIGNSAYHFAKISAEQGHDVVVFTPGYSSLEIERGGKYFYNNNGDYVKIKKDNEKKEGVKGFEVVFLKPFLQYGYAAFLPQLFWRLNGFDIVHLHYPFYGSVEVVLLKKILSGKKMKLITHYHMDTIGSGLKGLFFKINKIIFLSLVVRFSKLITCASLDYIKYSGLSGAYKKNSDKFRQTLFGVDTNKFHPIDNLRVSGEEKNILFVARLDRAHYFKGLHNLIKAVHFLSLDIEPRKLKLNIVGDGDLREYYKKLVKKLNIENIVNFLGNVDDKDLVNIYNTCDVFVLPSIDKSEAFGLVLLEAMASGRPVIASSLPGVRGVFKNGEQGFLTRPRDVKELSSKIRYILDNPEKSFEMGVKGRALTESKYTWEEVGKNLDIIYHYAAYTP